MQKSGIKRFFKGGVICKYFIVMTEMTGFGEESIFKVFVVLVERLCDFHGLYKFGLVLFAIFALTFYGYLLGLIKTEYRLDLGLGFWLIKFSTKGLVFGSDFS
jgi:hypothetical protein